MRILIACEFSGIVRDAFIKAGHDAISCDLLPTEQPGPHIQGDVTPLLRKYWDMVIAHPPCTYLCNSGVQWLHERTERWQKMNEATEFFIACLNANAEFVAVENPIMHGHAIKLIGRKQNFTIQPYEHGHPESKRTCFWTHNLPPLIPTKIIQKKNYTVHRMPPSPERWKERSRTYTGVADAMASQWGNVQNIPLQSELFHSS